MGREKKDNHLHFVLEYFYVDERRPQNKFSNYIIQIPPKEKAVFFEAIYMAYMQFLKKENPERYEFIKGFEIKLAKKRKMKTVLFLFKRIVPTIEDNDDEPFDLLSAAINDIENSKGHYSQKLHIFLTISTLRWAFLEKYILDFAYSAKGRQKNSWINSKEYLLLSPFFQKINTRYADENVISAHYNDLIYILIKQKKILRSLLEKVRQNRIKNRRNNENEISNALGLLTIYSHDDTEDNYSKVLDAILQIGEIKKHYQDKYRRFCDNINDNYLLFPTTVDRSFRLKDIKETFWKKLPPWNVKNFITEKEIDPKELTELLSHESMFLNKPSKSKSKKIPPLLINTMPTVPDIP